MYNRIAVYAVAHQDDWQLFMDPQISADINDLGCRTIIIHVTAGDAGDGRKYWRARELGAVSSLVFRISGKANLQVVSKNITINEKKVFRVNVSHCGFYFLRLPDGGMYGDGFKQYRFQSLSKLRLNTIGEIATVDSKNTFNSFKQVSGLINEIIKREQTANNIPDTHAIMLNFPEYDNSINPDDHNDHLNCALLIADMEIYDSVKKRAFVHYDIQHAADDLAGTDLFWKVGMFSVYHQTVLEKHGHSTIGETQQYSVWARKDAICRDVT